MDKEIRRRKNGRKRRMKRKKRGDEVVRERENSSLVYAK